MLEAVKQWAFTLVITAAAGGIAGFLTISPSSESGGMKRYVKFACAAVALAVMIMPIRELFREMPGLLDFNVNAYNAAGIEIYDNNINNIDRINFLATAKTGELLKHRISDIVYEKTGIKPDDVHIYIKQKDYSEIEVEKIIIYMSENHEEVKAYIKQLFNCEVEINEQ